MAYQNRVDPWGSLNAIDTRGQWLGNRGILHNEHQQIVAPWRHKTWVTCRLAYKDRHRTVFSPNNYSELFFLDEATAFSAGHRPCGQCRYQRYKEFKATWCRANRLMGITERSDVALIDRQLHKERAVRGGGKVVFKEILSDLPPGTFVQWSGDALLLWEDTLLRWTHHGYQPCTAAPSSSEVVSVLTPVSVVNLYRLGFRPQVHPQKE